MKTTKFVKFMRLFGFVKCSKCHKFTRNHTDGQFYCRECRRLYDLGRRIRARNEKLKQQYREEVKQIQIIKDHTPVFN